MQGEPAAALSGRASYRGGVREPRPGAGEPVKVPTQELAQLQVGTREGKDVGRRQRDYRYQDPNTRPAHIEDKRGKTIFLMHVKY